jgi:PAS domain S-box-containing protein
MGKALHVLMVEDREDDVLLVMEELKRGGYDPCYERVETEEGMRAALAGKAWDLVLCDYSLPRFDVRRAFAVMREAGPDLPFIVVSGQIGEETAVACMKGGAHDYVMKDNLSRLVPAIERELRESAVRLEKKCAEEALRQSEAKLKRLTDSAQDIIFRMSLLDGAYEYISPAVTGITGYSPEQFYENPYLMREIIHPDWRDYFDERWRELLNGEGQPSCEYPVVTGSGDVKWLHQLNIIVTGDKGKPIALEGIARDITGRRQAEEALRTSLHEKEVLLREVHHRVKNNLSVIVSLLELQSYRVSDGPTLSALKGSADRVRTMAMIHSKLYRSKDLTRVNLGEYLRELANQLVQSHGASRGIRFAFDVEEISFDIGTGVSLGLIVNELLSNALKHAFVPHGEGEIRIGLREARGEIILTLSDTGTGLSDDYDFTRPVTLGLRLVNALVTQLDGTISLEREDGTAFTIAFRREKA